VLINTDDQIKVEEPYKLPVKAKIENVRKSFENPEERSVVNQG